MCMKKKQSFKKIAFIIHYIAFLFFHSYNLFYNNAVDFNIYFENARQFQLDDSD